MVRQRPIPEVLLCSVLIAIVVDAAADARQRRIMRTEKLFQNPQALHIDGPDHGTMYYEVDHDGDPAADGERSEGRDVITEEACNNAYPLGLEGYSGCLEPHVDLIIDPDQCKQAAKMTKGIKVEDVAPNDEWDRFLKNEEAWDKHPRGCFAAPCKLSTGTCYWFNPVGEDPCVKPKPGDKASAGGAGGADGAAGGAGGAAAGAGGAAAGAGGDAAGAGAGTTAAPAGDAGTTAAPAAGNGTALLEDPDLSSHPPPHNVKCTGHSVCVKTKYTNGTRDANTGCEGTYKVIMTEQKCRQAAGCLGWCVGPDFLKGVLNATSKLDYPEGCFLDFSDGCLYLNPPEAVGKGTSVKGQQMCETGW